MKILRFALALLLSGWSTAAAFWHHPHDVIDAIALNPGYPGDPTLFVGSAGSMKIFVVSRNHGYTWTESRSGYLGFKVTDLAVASDWQSSGIVYVASLEAGLQRSTDRGMTYGPSLTSVSVEFIAAAKVPASGERVLFAASRRRMERAEDGVTFELVDLPLGEAELLSVEVSPAYESDQTVAVTTSDQRLLISESGGAEWRATTLPAPAFGLTFSPAYDRDGTLFLATHGAAALRSQDRGRSVERLGTGCDDPDANDIAVAPTYPADPHLWMATRDEGVFASRDGGQTWTRTSLRIPKTFQTKNHYLLLRVSAGYPEDPTVVCGTFEGLFFSRDAGESWRKSNINPTRMGRKLAISPDYAADQKVFLSGYGMQLLVSADGGDHWTQRCTDVYALSGYALGVSPDFKTDGLLFLGIDQGLRRTADGGASWSAIELPPHRSKERQSSYEVRTVLFSPAFREDRTVWAVHKGGIYTSHDAGLTFTSQAPLGEWTARLAVSPDYATDRTMLVGGEDLYLSTDGGQTFEGPLFDEPVTLIRFAPDYSRSREAFFISVYQGFHRSTDGGRTWSRSMQGMESVHPTTLLLSPDFERDGTLFVTTTGSGVFRSRDRGFTWERTTPFPSPVDHAFSSVISPDFGNDQTLFIGNYDGVWRSRDGGRDWSLVTDWELYDDSRQPWERTGDSWNRPTWKGCIGRGVTVSGEEGATMTLPFAGHGVKLYGTRGPDHGMAEIYLDQALVDTVDCYAPDLETQVVLADHPEIPFGFHTLRVKVLGKSRAEATGRKVAVDAAEVRYFRSSEALPVFAESWESGITATVSPRELQAQRDGSEAGPGPDAASGERPPSGPPPVAASGQGTTPGRSPWLLEGVIAALLIVIVAIGYFTRKRPS